jgi:hypothetical protein
MALYAVDAASEGGILQVGHIKKRMFIIMNTKAGAVDIANLLSEHAAAFQKITGSAITSWKPEGHSKGKTTPRDAATILSTIARLQAEWDAPPQPTAHPDLEEQQQQREREGRQQGPPRRGPVNDGSG